MSGEDYVIEVHDDPSQIDAQAWNSLLAAQPDPTPFMRHEVLAALHDSGSATAEQGWDPCFLTLHTQGCLQAACPLYRKHHSYGEYVFDWAWADAYQRHGLAYYPKLLCAVPFTPVPGPRLLARDTPSRQALLAGMQALAAREGLSSAHVLFLDEADRAAAAQAGWLARSTVQFHWHNHAGKPYAGFEDFLATLVRDKRRKIAQERRRVQEAGVRFVVREADQITGQDWDFFHLCYRRTYQAHYSTPYLRRAFFRQVARTLPQAWLMFIAYLDDRPIACSLIAIDRLHQAAWGRYWGAVEHVPCLHFEACYYQPLQWCIEQGFVRFEGGAQGAHKMARGLMPVTTWSAHWLSHPAFSDAVARFLEREGSGIEAYVDELREHTPYRAP